MQLNIVWYFEYAHYFIVINCLIQIDVTWRRTKNLLLSYHKQLKVTLLNLSLIAFWLGQNVIKNTCMNIFVSFTYSVWSVRCFYAKCIRDMTSAFVDASRSWDFLSGLDESADQIADKLNACCCSCWSWRASSYLPTFQYIAALDFVQQLVQTSSAKEVMLNSTLAFVKAKSYCRSY